MKNQLDETLIEFKAQPVGYGYIDIIVKRENILPFIDRLTSQGFFINALSWWLYLEANEVSNYGYGGPKSIYYTGWYSELPHDFDELDDEKIDNYLNSKNFNGISSINQHFSSIIFSKETNLYHDNQRLNFKTNLNLTPGFWISTPDDWKNILQK